MAAPWSTQILADLGADVIKIERPDVGDDTRGWGPPFLKDKAGEPTRDAGYFLAVNRGKRSVTVNLNSPEGREIILELAKSADVVIENYKVGTLKRYGLDYPAIRAVNERIVYVSCTGFGQTGPYAHKKGYDTVFQAMGGLMSLTGEKGGGPVKPGLPVADLTSGLWVAIAILAALAGRARTGKGCHVDFSMLDAQVSLLTLAAARFFALGEVPARLGTEHPGRVPSATFSCRDGKYAHITASDQHWAPLCKALGIDGKGLETNEIRVERRDEVMRMLRAKIEAMTRAELIARLDEADVPVGPVNDVAEILRDPHVRARRLVGSFDYPGVGEFKALALPYKFLGWDPPEIGRPPTLGEHTEQILAALNYSKEEIETLRQKRAI
jgi:crotonobetainyl-CoA:carnitine CoA-transferase CaiB-like acyl-CoA transferase